jgi:hypothetical protein
MAASVMKISLTLLVIGAFILGLTQAALATNSARAEIRSKVNRIFFIDQGQGELLNSTSILSDVVAFGPLCFAGQPLEACRILKALAYNSELDYAQGGHTLIEELFCSASAEESRLFVRYSEFSDYTLEGELKTLIVESCL